MRVSHPAARADRTFARALDALRSLQGGAVFSNRDASRECSQPLRRELLRRGALRLPHLKSARLAQPVHELRVAVLFVRPDLCQDDDTLPRPCQLSRVAKLMQCASRGLRRAGECIRSAETALMSWK